MRCLKEGEEERPKELLGEEEGERDKGMFFFVGELPGNGEKILPGKQ